MNAAYLQLARPCTPRHRKADTLRQDEPLSAQVSRLTDSEANALESHLRRAVLESQASGEHKVTVELTGTLTYVRNARHRRLGTGRAPKVPDTRIDEPEMAHEAVFGTLTADERRTLSVHLMYGWSESLSAGVSQATVNELQGLAYEADHAAAERFTTSGLTVGHTARPLGQPLQTGAGK